MLCILHHPLFLQAYTAAAFNGSEFFELINPTDSECVDGTSDCLFSTAESASMSSPDVCTAELYINRFVDIPIYLKCLDYANGYGTAIANKLIKALDKFFELEILPVLSLSIMDQAPMGHVYNFASPYASDRNYCGHGSYYAGGSLVHQVPCSDGILLTQFSYGFDVIWYKPLDFNGTLFENEDISAIINTVFEEADFLSYIKQEYPDYDFIQDIDECDVIDPAQCNVTFAPTEAFTFPPTSAPYVPIIESPPPTSSSPSTVDLLTFAPSTTPQTAIPSSLLRQPTMYPSFGSTDAEDLREYISLLTRVADPCLFCCCLRLFPLIDFLSLQPPRLLLRQAVPNALNHLPLLRRPVPDALSIPTIWRRMNVLLLPPERAVEVSAGTMQSLALSRYLVL